MQVTHTPKREVAMKPFEQLQAKMLIINKVNKREGTVTLPIPVVHSFKDKNKYF